MKRLFALIMVAFFLVAISPMPTLADCPDPGFGEGYDPNWCYHDDNDGVDPVDPPNCGSNCSKSGGLTLDPKPTQSGKRGVKRIGMTRLLLDQRAFLLLQFREAIFGSALR